MGIPFNDQTSTHVVAITGLAGSGKDTVADILATHVGFTKVAFADPLRAEITRGFDLGLQDTLLTQRDTKALPTARLALVECNDFGFIGAVARATAATVNGAWLQEPRSPRQILRWWGTEYRRAERVSYWTSLMERRIHSLHQLGHRRVVISDCRFENEAQTVRRLGGVLYQVTRPAESHEQDGEHASATDGAKLNPSACIVNDGTLQNLRDLVLGHWWAHEASLATVHVRIED